MKSWKWSHGCSSEKSWWQHKYFDYIARQNYLKEVSFLISSITLNYLKMIICIIIILSFMIIIVVLLSFYTSYANTIIQTYYYRMMTMILRPDLVAVNKRKLCQISLFWLTTVNLKEHERGDTYIFLLKHLVFLMYTLII